MSKIKPHYFYLIIVCYVFYKLIFDGVLKENEKNFYNQSSSKKITSILFEKKESVFAHVHKLNFPSPPGETEYFNSSIVFNAVTMGTTTIDLNKDGFVDFCFTQPDPQNPLLCYLNNKDNSFRDVTKEYGLNFPTVDFPSAIYAVDLNSDGSEDLLLVKYGRHDVLIRNGNKFEKVDNNWFSNSWGANFYDFNHDGLIDILFANYYAEVDLNKVKMPWSFKGVYNGTNGSPNQMYQNIGNGKFEIVENFFPRNRHELTTAIGVSDYDRDGHIDVFVANDYSIDRMYQYDSIKNQLKENTYYTIPVKKHGYSGMNAHFFDLNNDSYLDLYVTNIVLPPLMGISNLMWIWNPELKIFEEKASDLKINKCGYAWTAAEADFNNDGKSELVVASGFYANKNGQFNTIFNRLIEGNTPAWFPIEHPQVNLETFSQVSLSRPCLFTKGFDGFEDIADQVFDWDIKTASRSLVVTDINNDGLMDIIFNQQGGKSILYVNKSNHQNAWTGLIFKNKAGSSIHFGIQATIYSADGNRLKYFELNPANGFKTQNDFRYVLGIGPSTSRELILKVEYPIKKEFRIKENEYNEIYIN